MEQTGLTRDFRRRAKARLAGLIVHEVSLVDRPANEQPFLIVKADMNKKTKTEKSEDAEASKKDDAGTPAAPPPTAAAGEAAKEDKLVLPAEAQQLLTDALGDCAESLAGLNMQVAEATVQEGAPVPPALAEGLRAIAAKLTDVADQLGPAAAAEQSSAAPPTKTPEASASTAGLTVEQVEQAMERVIDRRMANAQKADEKGAGASEKSVAAALESRVTKALDELHVVTKAIHTQSILGPLAKPRQASNVQQVEKSTPSPESAAKKEPWPADLAKDAVESVGSR